MACPLQFRVTSAGDYRLENGREDLTDGEGRGDTVGRDVVSGCPERGSPGVPLLPVPIPTSSTVGEYPLGMTLPLPLPGLNPLEGVVYPDPPEVLGFEVSPGTGGLRDSGRPLPVRSLSPFISLYVTVGVRRGRKTTATTGTTYTC